MYFFKAILVFAVLGAVVTETILAKNCSLNARIVHGDYVEAYDAPFFCGIYTIDADRDLKFRCGASLISEETILTSAECFAPAEAYVAKCGSMSLLGGPYKPIPIDRYIRHPDYLSDSTDSIANNIALGFLKHPVECSERIKIIELQVDPINKAGNFKVYGFGSEDIVVTPGVYSPSYALKYLDSQYSDPNLCYDYFRRTLTLNNVPAGTFCGSTKDPLGTQCQADQGGPFVDVATGRQVAVVSFISQFCDVERPAVYTSVYDFLDFITENIEPKNYLVYVPTKKNGVWA